MAASGATVPATRVRERPRWLEPLLVQTGALLIAMVISLLIGAVLAGALLAPTRWCRLGRRLAWGGAVALLICGLTPLGDVLIRPLEARFPRAAIDSPAMLALIQRLKYPEHHLGPEAVTAALEAESVVLRRAVQRVTQ